MKKNTVPPKTEAISKETRASVEYHFYDEDSKPVHRSKIVYKNTNIIIVYPFSYSEANGVTKKRISTIEFRGWSKYEDLPKLLKPGERISLGHKKIGPLMRILYSEYPKLEKLIITKDGSTRFSSKTITFNIDDLEKICKGINKEIRTFESRRKTAALNGLAEISSAFKPRQTALSKGSLSHFLSFHGDDINLSATDTDAVLKLIDHVPFGNVSVTENFIQTKNKINVAYLEKIISKYESLLDVKGDNEKAWQEFFDDHGWILANVFPYQVLLYKREAYVGGKTIENNEGRVVDFLFHNNFRDNYALLEIKTHNKQILKANAYRAPDAFALHEDCSGAIAQCLDQKNTFLREMGQKYPTLDPKTVLIIGMKAKLNSNQANAFELMRSNQKNVDVVTFDEVLDKIIGLRSILQK